jgi:hypothetical protein
MNASFGDPVARRMMNEQGCYARFEVRAIMPSIALSEASFFAHFHMGRGIIAALCDAKAVGCDRVTWVRHQRSQK